MYPAMLNALSISPSPYLQRGRIACNAERCIVLATAIQSVRPSVCPFIRLLHAGTLPRRIKIGSCGLHYEVAKTI